LKASCDLGTGTDQVTCLRTRIIQQLPYGLLVDSRKVHSQDEQRAERTPFGGSLQARKGAGIEPPVLQKGYFGQSRRIG